MSEVRTVARHTLVYGVGMMIAKLASVIMLPVYTSHLSTADYGVLELLTTTLDVIGMLASLGLAASLFKYYAAAETDEARHELVSTVALGSSGIAFGVMILGVAAAEPLTRLVFTTPQPTTYFRIFFVTYFTQNITTIAMLAIQAEQRSRLFVAINVARLLITLTLTVTFLVHLRMGVMGVLLANSLAAGVVSLALAIYTIRRVGHRFSVPLFRVLTRFGAPLVVWSIGSFILTYSDRYFVNAARGESAVGVYSLAYKFSFVLSALAAAPFGQTWQTRQFTVARQPDSLAIYRRMFLYFNLVLFAVSIGLVLFVRDALVIMVKDPAYLVAIPVVPLLLIATILQQWTQFCNVGLFLKDATAQYGWSAVAAIALALTLNALLIPPFGIMGAALATVITYAIRFVIVYFLSQRQFRIDYPWSSTGILGLMLLGAWGARRILDPLPLIPSIGGSAVLFLAITFAMYFLMLSRRDRAAIESAVKRVKQKAHE